MSIWLVLKQLRCVREGDLVHAKVLGPVIVVQAKVALVAIVGGVSWILAILSLRLRKKWKAGLGI